MFTWIPIHREAVRKMLELPQPQKEILAVLREMEQEQLKVTGLNDRGGDTVFPLREIDPLTFLAMFNRGISERNKQHNWQFLKARWHLSSDVPKDFDGIPTVNNQRSWFFPYSDKRGKQDVERLWQLVRQVADRTPEQVDGSLFDQCLADWRGGDSQADNRYVLGQPRSVSDVRPGDKELWPEEGHPW